MTQSESIFVTNDGTGISALIKEFIEAHLEEMANAASEAKAAANAEAAGVDSTKSHTWQWVKQKGEIAVDAFAYALGSAIGQAVAAGIVIVVLGAIVPRSDRGEV